MVFARRNRAAERAAPPKPAAPRDRWWQLTSYIKVSPTDWGPVSAIAAIVGTAAMLNNAAMVWGHAIERAMEAPPFPEAAGAAGLEALAQHAVNVSNVGGQIAGAILLQFGTDFLLVMAVALAATGARIMPSLAVAGWIVCVLYTAQMKYDIYDDRAAARLALHNAEALAAFRAAEPADVKAARRLLAGYGEPPKKTEPPSQPASRATIETAQAAIGDLTVERAEKVAARAAEAETGRSTRYAEFDAELRQIDADLAAARNRIEAARIALADRQAFDDASILAARADKLKPEPAKEIGYDSFFMRSLRVWGLQILSLIGILAAFAGRAKRHAQRLADAPEPPAQETVFTVVMPEERGLPAPDGRVAEGVAGTADTRTPGLRDRPHPDRRGDGAPDVTEQPKEG